MYLNSRDLNFFLRKNFFKDFLTILDWLLLDKMQNYLTCVFSLAQKAVFLRNKSIWFQIINSLCYTREFSIKFKDYDLLFFLKTLKRLKENRHVSKNLYYQAFKYFYFVA